MMFAYLERKALDCGVAFNFVIVLYWKCSPFGPVWLVDEKPLQVLPLFPACGPNHKGSVKELMAKYSSA